MADDRTVRELERLLADRADQLMRTAVLLTGSRDAKWVTVRWALYVNPTTYLPVRIEGSGKSYGGSAATYVSSGVTDVRWLPPTKANIAKTMVTIPPGFRKVGLADV
jgi:hypothetical protein